jgi:hypothetical protein
MDDIVQGIHLYSEMRTSRGTWSQYPHPLPYGMQFGMSKATIIERCGAPHIGTGVKWGTYRLGEHGMRVGYDQDRLVTLALIWKGSSLLS